MNKFLIVSKNFSIEKYKKFSRKCFLKFNILWSKDDINILDNRKSSNDFISLKFGAKKFNEFSNGLSISLNNNSVEFITDSVSSIPIYYFIRNKQFIFSSHLYLIIDVLKSFEIQPSLDLQSAAELISASYVYSPGRTLIDQILKVPGRSIAKFSVGKRILEIESYDDGLSYKFTSDFDDNKKKLIEVLTNGLDNYRDKSIGLMLSGGADSRLILNIISSLNMKVDLLTFGQSTVNVSDFSILRELKNIFNYPAHAFVASAEHIIDNFEQVCLSSNWSDMWHFGKLPQQFFDQLSSYDVVLRGDGDGMYGWKSVVSCEEDALHLLEISPLESVSKGLNFLKKPEEVLQLAKISRDSALKYLKNLKFDMQSKVNIGYQKYREAGCIAPNISLLNSFTNTDSPLTWINALNIAKKLEQKDRKNKKIIFSINNNFHNSSLIRYSDGPSWNDFVDLDIHNVNEYFINLCELQSPFEILTEKLKLLTQKPLSHMREKRFWDSLNKYKNLFQNNNYLRRYCFSNKPHLFHSSIMERPLFRMAVLSHLNKYIKT